MRTKLFVLIATLALITISTQAVSAQRGSPAFTELRTAIADNVDAGKQRSYLSKVEHAEVQLPPNPCVALHSLDALSHHVDAQAGKKFLSAGGARAIQDAIALTMRDYLPPGPCSG